MQVDFAALVAISAELGQIIVEALIGVNPNGASARKSEDSVDDTTMYKS